MEYLWIIILVCIYVSLWVCVIDDWDKVYWDKITFPKVWAYIHLIALILGIIALFVVSLVMFIKGR